MMSSAGRKKRSHTITTPMNMYAAIAMLITTRPLRRADVEKNGGNCLYSARDRRLPHSRVQIISYNLIAQHSARASVALNAQSTRTAARAFREWPLAATQ